jgi:hypothetical protein
MTTRTITLTSVLMVFLIAGSLLALAPYAKANPAAVTTSTQAPLNNRGETSIVSGTIYSRPTTLPLPATLALLMTALGLCLSGAFLIEKDSPEAYRTALIPRGYRSQQTAA